MTSFWISRDPNIEKFVHRPFLGDKIALEMQRQVIGMISKNLGFREEGGFLSHGSSNFLSISLVKLEIEETGRTYQEGIWRFTNQEFIIINKPMGKKNSWKTRRIWDRLWIKCSSYIYSCLIINHCQNF